MTATRPAPTDAQVEALGRDLCRSRGDVWPCDACVSTARAALSSDVIGDLIAEQVALALRGAGEAIARRRQELYDSGVGQPRQMGLVDAEHVVAALSPTPAERPCERDDGPDPNHEDEGWTCVTHNRPWPCPTPADDPNDPRDGERHGWGIDDFDPDVEEQFRRDNAAIQQAERDVDLTTRVDGVTPAAGTGLGAESMRVMSDRADGTTSERSES